MTASCSMSNNLGSTIFSPSLCPMPGLQTSSMCLRILIRPDPWRGPNFSIHNPSLPRKPHLNVLAQDHSSFSWSRFCGSAICIRLRGEVILLALCVRSCGPLGQDGQRWPYSRVCCLILALDGATSVLLQATSLATQLRLDHAATFQEHISYTRCDFPAFFFQSKCQGQPKFK